MSLVPGPVTHYRVAGATLEVSDYGHAVSESNVHSFERKSSDLESNKGPPVSLHIPINHSSATIDLSGLFYSSISYNYKCPTGTNGFIKLMLVQENPFAMKLRKPETSPTR